MVVQLLRYRARHTESGHLGAEPFHSTTALFCPSRKRDAKRKMKRRARTGLGDCAQKKPLKTPPRGGLTKELLREGCPMSI